MRVIVSPIFRITSNVSSAASDNPLVFAAICLMDIFICSMDDTVSSMECDSTDIFSETSSTLACICIIEDEVSSADDRTSSTMRFSSSARVDMV